MTRNNRLAILAALVLLVVAAGTVLGTRAPQPEGEPAGNQQDGEDDAPPDAEAIQHAIDRLDHNEIPVPGDFADLAGRYGLGGAVRLSAWASQTGMSVDELAAMRDTGGTDGGPMGWGRLAKDLREQGFDVRPGLGSIMGGGRGPGEDPPGQVRNSDD
jgi:hypothetical protein